MMSQMRDELRTTASSKSCHFITFDWFSYTTQIKGRSPRLHDLPLNTLHNSEQMEYSIRESGTPPG